MSDFYLNFGEISSEKGDTWDYSGLVHMRKMWEEPIFIFNVLHAYSFSLFLHLDDHHLTLKS